MVQITVSGVDTVIVEGLNALADNYGMARSRVARQAFRDYLNDRDDVPEHVKKDVSFEKLTDENRWKMRVMWFESNVREFFNDCLERDISPPPERVEWAFVESAHREIVEQAPDRYRDDMQAFLVGEKNRYAALYWARNPAEADHNSKRREQVVGFCAKHWSDGRQDMVIEYSRELHKQGNAPTGMGADAIISAVKREAKDSDGWQGDGPLSADNPRRAEIDD